MTHTPQVLLAHHRKTLKLPTFLREYGKLARQCAAEGVDHVRYRHRLAALELIDRERRMVERRIKAARFPVVKSLDCSSAPAARTSSAARMSSRSATQAPARPTSPSVSAWRPCRKGLSLDELGFVPLSKTGAELLFEVFSQRYERGAILVTSNLPFDEWTEVFGSERLTGALLDRLTHHVYILKMNGESCRLNQSRQRRDLSRRVNRPPCPRLTPCAHRTRGGCPRYRRRSYRRGLVQAGL